MQSEEQTLKRIQSYIDLNFYNKSGVLWNLPTEARTKKVVELVLSRPDIFNIDKELSIIPPNLVDDETKIKCILYNPGNFNTLSKSGCDMPMMVAFMMSKKMHDFFISQGAPVLGYVYPRVYVPEVVSNNRAEINDIIEKININFTSAYAVQDYKDFIHYVAQRIMAYFNPELIPEKLPNVVPFGVPNPCASDFDDLPTVPEAQKPEPRVAILISGCGKSGKTTIGKSLASRIKGATFIDSDQLLEEDLYGLPLAEVLPEDTNIIVFADLFAHRYFVPEDFASYTVVNILVQPINGELDVEHSRYRAAEFRALNNPIIALNDYTEKGLDDLVPKLVQKISERIGTPLEMVYPGAPGKKGSSMKRKRLR